MIGLQKYGNDESPWWEKKSEEIAKAGQRKGCQESEKKTNKTKIKNKTRKKKTKLKETSEHLVYSSTGYE